MDREQALHLLRQYVKNENLIRHMLAVEAAMRDYANYYGEDAEEWGLAGLLHDFDWEIHPDLTQHPQDGVPILRQHGVPEIIVRTILSHADHTNVPRDSRMEKALYACDELTGLITAVALVRPSHSIGDVTVKSIRKKWKDSRFAAAINRGEIERGAQELGVDLWEHVGRVLASMQRISADLGLQGTLAPSSPSQIS
jgi:putative nucleotidyltransferase with HDIG domain